MNDVFIPLFLVLSSANLLTSFSLSVRLLFYDTMPPKVVNDVVKKQEELLFSRRLVEKATKRLEKSETITWKKKN
jgi:hypothetical protein